MDNNCVFCKIINGELLSFKIYEDKFVYAFLDIHPVNAGHTLIVPKKHISHFSNLMEAEAGKLFIAGHKILRAIEESGIKCEGANLFLSDKPIAGQEVMHSHLHIVPRFEGDGHKIGFSHSNPDETDIERLKQTAKKIVEKLQRVNNVPAIKQPSIETKRLILEPYKDTDLNDIFDYASNSEVSKFVPWNTHKCYEDSKQFLEYIRNSTNYVKGELFFVFAIRLKESGRVIGSIDFKNYNSRCGQIDYALSYDYWNKGIVTEAAEAIIDWAFNTLDELVRIQAFCVIQNIGSSRVMEKIGMEKEGISRKSFILRGQAVDLIRYALLR